MGLPTVPDIRRIFGLLVRGLVPGPTQADIDNQRMLRADGVWGDQPTAGFPSATGNAGKVITTDGTNPQYKYPYEIPGVVEMVAARANLDSLFADGFTAGARRWRPLQAGVGAKFQLDGIINIPSANPSGSVYGFFFIGAGNSTYDSPSATFSMSGFVTTGGAIRVMLSSGSPNYYARWIEVNTNAVTKWGGTAVPFHLTFDGTNAPTLYIEGQVQACTESTSGGASAPAWTQAISDAYLVWFRTGVNDYFRGRIVPGELGNAHMSAAEILTHARTGRRPSWWVAGTGSMTQQTSGTLNAGWKYRIVTYNAGDSFTNVGAASNASGVEFIAQGTTPTTWTNASALIPLGPLFQENIDPNNAHRDTKANGLHAVCSPGVFYIGAKIDSVGGAKVSHPGAGNLQFCGGPFFDATKGWVIEALIVRSSAAVTWSLGNASGGAQYVSGYALSIGDNLIPAASFVSRNISGANLWSNSSGAADITIFPKHARTF